MANFTGLSYFHTICKNKENKAGSRAYYPSSLLCLYNSQSQISAAHNALTSSYIKTGARGTPYDSKIIRQRVQLIKLQFI